MKWLVLFIPFIAHANYTDIDKVDHVSKSEFSVYMRKEVCERETKKPCVQIPKRFNYEYHEKSGSSVVVNQTKKDAYDAQKAADASAENTKRTARRAARIRLKAADCSQETGVVKDLCLQYK